MKDFKISFYKDKNQISKIQDEHIIIYMISGKASVIVNGEPYSLESQDFMIINSGSAYTLNTAGDSFTILIEINAFMLQEMSESVFFHFQCCSSVYDGVKYEKFRYMLQNLLGEYAIDRDGISCKKLSILFSICDSMLHFFAISDMNAGSSRSDTSTQFFPVIQYVSAHYKEKIALEQMAGLMYMTSSSFSRKFKKTFGNTFVSYVTKVRLNHALDDLLHSALPVSDIALNNGFGSSSQFNKAFKEAYNLSPREYKSVAVKKSNETVNDNNLSDTQVAELKSYLSRTRLTVVKEQKLHIQEIKADCSTGQQYTNPFGDIITLGFASRLLSGEYQHHIEDLKQNLNFKYGTINGLFSPEMKLFDTDTEKMNFVNLDQVLDFLVTNNIKPLIVYDNQIFTMMKNKEDIREISTVSCFKSTAQFAKVTGAIIDHCLNRYGIKEVSEWKFSMWYYTLTESIFGFRNRFCEIWDTFYGSIRARISDAEIGGCGYSHNAEIRDRGIRDFYTEWKNCKYLPDFITLFCFPYKNSDMSKGTSMQRMNIDRFMDESITGFKKILQDVSFPEKPIYIIEWNLSMFQRNAFNDMAAKAPIMLNQMIHTLGEVDRVCYWYASDISANDVDSNLILTGSCGLMSANGIYKPSFYALRFFRDLYNITIARGDHYIITKDELGHFSIILFNNKTLNYYYYSTPEESICINDEINIFTEHDSLEITLTLTNIPDKSYMLRRQIIGPQRGSVLDEWLRFGSGTDLSLSDLDYLKRRCVPYRSTDVVRPTDNSLTLKEVLDEHELMLLTLT